MPLPLAPPNLDSESTPDSLDRFLHLTGKARQSAISADERVEWTGLIHTLLRGEVDARARRNPGEGRRQLRTSVRLLARVQGTHGRPATVSASLGTGGLKLHAALPFKVGDPLEVTVPLPEVAAPVIGRARVAWRRLGSVGIEFVDLADVDRELLESTVVEAMLRSR